MIALKFIIFALIGGGLGYLFYKKVGCATGSCPITSNPYISTGYGVVLGLILAGGL